MSVSCECCVLSGRGFCVGLITRPEESYRLWCVSDCDRNEEALAPVGAVAPWKKNISLQDKSSTLFFLCSVARPLLSLSTLSTFLSKK
jgi:hypothetical protein